MKTGQAGADTIKITPEMVVAGAAELADRADDPADEICQDVFAAMIAAAGIHQSISKLSLEAVEAHRLARRHASSRKVRPPAVSRASSWVDVSELAAIDL